MFKNRIPPESHWGPSVPIDGVLARRRRESAARIQRNRNDRGPQRTSEREHERYAIERTAELYGQILIEQGEKQDKQAALEERLLQLVRGMDPGHRDILLRMAESFPQTLQPEAVSWPHTRFGRSHAEMKRLRHV